MDVDHRILTYLCRDSWGMALTTRLEDNMVDQWDKWKLETKVVDPPNENSFVTEAEEGKDEWVLFYHRYHYPVI
jgi:hypothetical protein